MIATMSKKIAKTDRRGVRYVPITRQELVDAAERLGRHVGVMLETAEEMQSLGIEAVTVNGRGAFFEAVETLAKYAKEMKIRIGLEQVD